MVAMWICRIKARQPCPNDHLPGSDCNRLLDVRLIPILEILKCEKLYFLEVARKEILTMLLDSFWFLLLRFWSDPSSFILEASFSHTSHPAERDCCALCLHPLWYVSSSTLGCILEFTPRPVINVQKIKFFFFLLGRENLTTFPTFGRKHSPFLLYHGDM